MNIRMVLTSFALIATLIYPFISIAREPWQIEQELHSAQRDAEALRALQSGLNKDLKQLRQLWRQLRNPPHSNIEQYVKQIREKEAIRKRKIDTWAFSIGNEASELKRQIDALQEKIRAEIATMDKRLNNKPILFKDHVGDQTIIRAYGDVSKNGKTIKSYLQDKLPDEFAENSKRIKRLKSELNNTKNGKPCKKQDVCVEKKVIWRFIDGRVKCCNNGPNQTCNKGLKDKCTKEIHCTKLEKQCVE